MSVEYQPLSPSEIQELRLKEGRGELTAEDTMRFIASTRAKFRTIPTKGEKAPRVAKEPKGPKPEKVDFF